MKLNKSFASLIYETRQKALKQRSVSKSLIYWVEDHRSREGPVSALVFILPTRGCSWALSRSGGCSICGYIYDNPIEPNFEAIIEQFNRVIDEKLSNDKKWAVKIFTSGSALDPRELPRSTLKALLLKLSEHKENIIEVVLESRPEYVNMHSLELIKSAFDISKIEIAIGLESANNKILRDSINKGFTWNDFVRASNRVQKYGAKVKAYLLFKPPFISEYDAILDVIESTKKLVKLGVDIVSINAISIHRGTYLSRLFEERKYRTPWLWSLVYVCKYLKSNYPNLRIICDPVSGGKDRGAHNCGDCDNHVLKSLKKFTLTQDPRVLQLNGFCSCINEWEKYIVHEKLTLSEIVF